MIFIIVFAILYGLGFGVCRLSTMLFSGSDANLVRNMGYVPILNVVAAVIIIMFLFYIVKDYRRNNKQESNEKDKSETTIK